MSKKEVAKLFLVRNLTNEELTEGQITAFCSNDSKLKPLCWYYFQNVNSLMAGNFLHMAEIFLADAYESENIEEITKIIERLLEARDLDKADDFDKLNFYNFYHKPSEPKKFEELELILDNLYDIYSDLDIPDNSELNSLVKGIIDKNFYYIEVVYPSLLQTMMENSQELFDHIIDFAMGELPKIETIITILPELIKHECVDILETIFIHQNILDIYKLEEWDVTFTEQLFKNPLYDDIQNVLLRQIKTFANGYIEGIPSWNKVSICRMNDFFIKLLEESYKEKAQEILEKLSYIDEYCNETDDD